MKTTLYTVGQKDISVLFENSDDMFTCTNELDAKHRFYHFLKNYIENNPFSESYKNFALYSLVDLDNSANSPDVVSNVRFICDSSFYDLDDYSRAVRDRVLDLSMNPSFKDLIKVMVNDELECRKHSTI